jgi:hypothetical protein
VLANTDRPGDQSLDEAIAEHLTDTGHPIGASRVRTYLAELRREAAVDAAPAHRPHVVVNREGAST